MDICLWKLQQDLSFKQSAPQGAPHGIQGESLASMTNEGNSFSDLMKEQEAAISVAGWPKLANNNAQVTRPRTEVTGLH